MVSPYGTGGPARQQGRDCLHRPPITCPPDRVAAAQPLLCYGSGHRFAVVLHEIALVITNKSARDPSPSFLRASAHALRMTTQSCHPERSEGSVAHIRPADPAHVALPT